MFYLVEVWLPYGRTEVCARIPTGNLLAVIEPKTREGALNPQAEIENALMTPLGVKPLVDVARPGVKVSIVLQDCDPSTNNIAVSAVLKQLSLAGVKDEDVSVIVAYDPFRVYSTVEGKPLLDEFLSARVSLVRHDCEKSEHAHIGKTSQSTDVYLNKSFAEAKVKILVGVVEPHSCAGYSGGREAVLPGISSKETIEHTLSLGLNPKAGRGSLEGNPVHEDMVEAAHLADVDFALNVVRNNRLEIVKAFAGGLDEAFHGSVKLAEEMYKVPVESRADIVFVSPGGYPFDVSFFEASKCIDGALETIKKGKVIVLVAECMGGYGNKEFSSAISRFKDARALEKALTKHFTVGGFIAYHFMMALQSAEMALVSVMPDYFVTEYLKMKTTRTANEAIDYAYQSVGSNGKVSVIPYGNLTIPFISATE